MTSIRRLSRVIAIPLAPLLYAQGRRLRRDTVRLPDAALPWSGALEGPDPIRLLVLGDSTAAGVGADTQDQALPGNLARELHAHSARGVEWAAMGENGATARDLIRKYQTAARFDVIFLSVGANDALSLRSRGAFGRDIQGLLNSLRSSSPDATILVSSLPAFFRFTLLPQPLRWSLYLHSSSLEDAARAIVAPLPGVHMSPPPPPYTEGFFAADLFHPGADGYRQWARFAIDDAVRAGAL